MKREKFTSPQDLFLGPVVLLLMLEGLEKLLIRDVNS